jgi:hypothetical protein
VFKSGTANGSSGVIPGGGQLQPISGVGANLLWKKAQKILMKNITSEAMKKTIPHRRPLATTEVWHPWKVASRITSRHHCATVSPSARRPKNIGMVLDVWNHVTSPMVRQRELAPHRAGHGL